MITYTSEVIRRDTMQSIQCDVCKVTHGASDPQSLEYFSFQKIGGYASKHDLVSMEVDICESCALFMFGDYLRFGV